MNIFAKSEGRTMVEKGMLKLQPLDIFLCNGRKNISKVERCLLPSYFLVIKGNTFKGRKAEKKWRFERDVQFLCIRVIASYLSTFGYEKRKIK